MGTFLLVLAVVGVGVYALYAHHLDKLDAAARRAEFEELTASFDSLPKPHGDADRDAA